MKIGDMVMLLPGLQVAGARGCLASTPPTGWGPGLVREIYRDGNAEVLWSKQGSRLFDVRYLKVCTNESR